jgi:hypothetical protein
MDLTLLFFGCFWIDAIIFYDAFVRVKIGIILQELANHGVFGV